MNKLNLFVRHLLAVMLSLGFTAVFATPVDPTLLAIETEGGKVEISWEAPQSVSHYTLQKSTDGVSFEVIATGVTVNTATVSLVQSVVDPHAGSSSFYRLDIETKATTYSQTVLVTENVEKAAKLSVYPNPVSIGQKVNIQLKNMPDGQDISLTLMDILGQKISSLWIDADEADNLHEMEIPASIPQGNYFLIARSRDGVYKHTIKMVIRKGGGH